MYLATSVSQISSSVAAIEARRAAANTRTGKFPGRSLMSPISVLALDATAARVRMVMGMLNTKPMMRQMNVVNATVPSI